MSKRPENKFFSNTEVAAIIESFRTDFSIFGERLSGVCEDVSILKEMKQDLDELKMDVKVIKDVLRIEIPSIKSRLTSLEAKSA